MALAIQVQKFILRRYFEKKLARLGVDARKASSRKILRKILKHPVYKKSRNLLSYVSFRSEVDTGPLIRQALKAGKNVYVPRIQPGKKIHMVRIQNFRRDLRKGAYGILEPRSGLRPGNPARLDLVFAPGLGFDRKGRRLGRGGGYFDRFLARAWRAEKIGLAFRAQVVSKIPVEKHDQPVNWIITD